jgi:hypothetical protein
MPAVKPAAHEIIDETYAVKASQSVVEDVAVSIQDKSKGYPPQGNDWESKSESLALLPKRTFQEPLDEEKRYQLPYGTIPGWDDYKAMVRVLLKHLPHMTTDMKPPLNPASALVSVCNFHTSENPRVIFSGDLMDGKDVTFDEVIRSEHPADVTAQLVLVEDLSSLAMLTLGRSLSLPPEVFTEHLINAKFGERLHQLGHQVESRHWVTPFLKKEHLSLRWFRPVRRRVDREFLLWSSFAQTKERRTNIGRSFWDILIDHKHVRHVLTYTVLSSAWEERVTILRRQKGPCTKGRKA